MKQSLPQFERRCLGWRGLRIWSWLAIWLCICLAASSMMHRPARAQSTDDELTADEGALDEETSAAPSSTPTSSPTTRNEPEERSLLDTLIDGGIVGLLIGVLSVVSLGFIIEHSMSIRKSTLIPEDVAEELESLIQGGKVDEAIEAAEDPNNDSLIADVVLAGLRRYKASEFGFAEYKAAVRGSGRGPDGPPVPQDGSAGRDRRDRPDVGSDRHRAGHDRSVQQDRQYRGCRRPDELAGGIGKALVTTLMGLVVAIPTMIAFSFFRNKIDSIVAEAGKRVEQIMMPLGRRRQS